MATYIEQKAANSPVRRENFLKQGLLAHFEQIVKCGGGHWISPLCAVLKFKHQSVI